MTHFFFDVVRDGRRDYDFVGRKFRALDDARAHSELLAMDLGYAESERDPSGWVVHVLTPEGKLAHCTLVSKVAEFE